MNKKFVASTLLIVMLFSTWPIEASADIESSDTYAPEHYGLPNKLSNRDILAVLSSENTICLPAKHKTLVVQVPFLTLEEFQESGEQDRVINSLTEIATNEMRENMTIEFVGPTMGSKEARKLQRQYEAQTRELVRNLERQTRMKSQNELTQALEADTPVDQAETQRSKQESDNQQPLDLMPESHLIKPALQNEEDYCPRLYAVPPDGTETKFYMLPPRGAAIIANPMASNGFVAQSMIMTSPTVGCSQEAFSASLNNVMTNEMHGSTFGFIQNGFMFQNCGGGAVWTDTYQGLQARYYSMAYFVGHRYRFTITKNQANTRWWACAENKNVSGSYSCVQVGVTGSYMRFDTNTGYFFENANTNVYWYTGFTNPKIDSASSLFMHYPYNWSIPYRSTLHNCGSSWPAEFARQNETGGEKRSIAIKR